MFRNASLRMLAVLGLMSSSTLGGQAVSRYPFRPVPFADSAEIALARSAAPPEVSDSADIYVVRDGQVTRLHAGTSGSACMVGRDLHEGSLYPICFNPEGARTSLQRELMQSQLRQRGLAEDSVERVIEAAYQAGTLKTPTQFALAYMMSPRQVLFSSPHASGVRIGAWSSHLMIYTPHASRREVGLAREGPAARVIQVGVPGTHHTEVVVRVPRWSDGTPSP